MQYLSDLLGSLGDAMNDDPAEPKIDALIRANGEDYTASVASIRYNPHTARVELLVVSDTAIGVADNG